MTKQPESFHAGIDFESVLRIISKQVYETPHAFIRENVQNAVDAIRLQAYRDGSDPMDDRYGIQVSVERDLLEVKDNGIGMSADDLRDFFWTIGASGKRNAEAKAAGCVGTFGIGGFANFGVCSTLEVISQTNAADHGTLTRLSESDIRAAGSSIPSVTVATSADATPRGTVVRGYLRDSPNTEDLKQYLVDCARFVPVSLYFNNEQISQNEFVETASRSNYSPISDSVEHWTDGEIDVSGRLFEDRGHTVVGLIDGLRINGESTDARGSLRFENGAINVFKHGFKLCTTQIGSTIGVSGRIDCDRFVPTAGRDSLDSDSTTLLARIVALLEKVVIETILDHPERIAQNARIFRYVTRHGLVHKLSNVAVRLADGSETTLGDIQTKANQGQVGVFFGLSQKQALNQIMHARGHIVVLLSSDRYRQAAEQQYLESYCGAKAFEGLIDCSERYEQLSRFELVFLSEIEACISRSYEVKDFRVIAGLLTEDIPVYLNERGRGQSLDIFVDVRHPEVTKLEGLGYTSIMYSLISTFCHEYLGPSLKKWSPKFFGDGALNLELLSKRRSELWILVKDDIGEIRRGPVRQIVTSSDVGSVNVSRNGGENPPNLQKPNPRILRIIDENQDSELAGYYIRVPDKAFEAYGDLLQACESRGVVWAGNKITFVASDTISAAFQYEVRLDELVYTKTSGTQRTEGALELVRPFQEIFDSIYFPIPPPLEGFLVPTGAQEIRLDLHCEWIDMRTARHWLPAELVA